MRWAIELDNDRKSMRSALRSLGIRAALTVPHVARLYNARNALRAERDSLLKSVGDRSRESDPPRGEAGEQGRRGPDSPFYHYHSLFRLEEIIRRHAAPVVTPRPGLFVNFLDVAIDPRFLP